VAIIQKIIWVHSRYESREKNRIFFIFGYLLKLIIKIWQFDFFKESSEFGPFFHGKYFV
jgi:hypothetical protein